MPLYRHFASFLSMFKLVLIGVIILGKDPFALFGMQAPGLWIYACMMVFFFSNMIENQCMSTGAFEITLNEWLCGICLIQRFSLAEVKHAVVALSLCFVVKLSYGCEVTFMTVCAESRSSASAHPMLRVVLIEPLGDAPPTDAGAGFMATTVAI
ncbi:hypothetical protein PO909_030449 [Leuciscus waleckii]